MKSTNVILLLTTIVAIGCKPKAGNSSLASDDDVDVVCDVTIKIPFDGVDAQGKAIDLSKAELSITKDKGWAHTPKGCFDWGRKFLADRMNGSEYLKRNLHASSADFTYKGVTGTVYGDTTEADWASIQKKFKSVDSQSSVVKPSTPTSKDTSDQSQVVTAGKACTLTTYNNNYGPDISAGSQTQQAADWQACYKLAKSKTSGLAKYQYVMWSFDDSTWTKNDSWGYVDRNSSNYPAQGNQGVGEEEIDSVSKAGDSVFDTSGLKFDPKK